MAKSPSANGRIVEVRFLLCSPASVPPFADGN
jgi:hypothetical protein